VENIYKKIKFEVTVQLNRGASVSKCMSYPFCIIHCGDHLVSELDDENIWDENRESNMRMKKTV